MTDLLKTNQLQKPYDSERNTKNNLNPLSVMAGVICNVLFGALLIIMAVLAFFLAQSSITGGPPSIFGHQMYIIFGNSMNPAFETGDLALVSEINPEMIETGDVITYVDAGSGDLTTHRVIGVNRGEELTFSTRGDSSNINDPYPVQASTIIGKVSKSLPYLGYLMGFAQTRQGLIFLIFIPGAFVIIWELRKINKYTKETKRGSNKSGA